jgi:hypothetical protein
LQAAFSSLLSLTVVDPDLRPDVAQVAVNAAGDALLVWSSFAAPSGRTVLARTFDAAGQVWSATQALGVLAAFDPATSLSLGIDDAGNATVVMAPDGAGPSAVRFDRGTGRWSAPLALGSANCPSQVGAPQRLAVNGRGDAWLAWMIDAGFGRSPSDSPGLCSRRYDANTATWMPERRIDFAPGNGRLPGAPTLALAFSANGHAVLAWTQSSAVLATRFVVATEDWGTAVSLANPSGGGDGLSLALDASGTAMAAWVGTDNGVMVAVSEAATPAWRAAVPVGRGNFSAPVAALPLGNNRFHVLWERLAGASPAIQGASWDPVALAWSGAQTVAAQGARLVAAAGDGAGSMMAVFSYQPGAGLTPVLGSSRWDAITSNWVIGAEPLSGPLVADYWQPGTLRVAGGQAVVTWQQRTDPGLSGGTWTNVVGRLSAGP